MLCLCHCVTAFCVYAFFRTVVSKTRWIQVSSISTRPDWGRKPKLYACLIGITIARNNPVSHQSEYQWSFLVPLIRGIGTISSPNWQYIPLIYHLYIAYWVIIYHLPPIKGTRNSYWEYWNVRKVSHYFLAPGVLLMGDFPAYPSNKWGVPSLSGKMLPIKKYIRLSSITIF